MSNFDLVEQIVNSFNEKKNSHAFLFVTNNIELCFDDVIHIIKRVNCLNHVSNDCNCNVCNLIDNNNNPDVIVISPDGKEIKKDQVLGIIDTFKTKPLVSSYSTYVIREADKLNDSSANKILKFLEEPEDNIVGFFITDKVERIIPTVRSRCELFHFNYGLTNLLDILSISSEEFDKYFNISLDLSRKLNELPKYMLLAEMKKLVKMERQDIIMIMDLLRKFYVEKLYYVLGENGGTVDVLEQIFSSIDVDDVKSLVNRIKLLDNTINNFSLNVNKDLFINKLILEWE